jgi:hypothetical protein
LILGGKTENGHRTAIVEEFNGKTWKVIPELAMTKPRSGFAVC